jgi:hypothetical protein
MTSLVTARRVPPGAGAELDPRGRDVRRDARHEVHRVGVDEPAIRLDDGVVAAKAWLAPIPPSFSMATISGTSVFMISSK